MDSYRSQRKLEECKPLPTPNTLRLQSDLFHSQILGVRAVGGGKSKQCICIPCQGAIWRRNGT